MTNGDRIRQMSDEELFDDYLYMIDCSQCDHWRGCKRWRDVDWGHRHDVCRKMWLDWLSKEEDDGRDAEGQM